MDLNISAYRFVNVTTYAYNYQIMIKEHSVKNKTDSPREDQPH